LILWNIFHDHRASVASRFRRIDGHSALIGCPLHRLLQRADTSPIRLLFALQLSDFQYHAGKEGKILFGSHRGDREKLRFELQLLTETT
jgi:hypothetical protein